MYFKINQDMNGFGKFCQLLFLFLFYIIGIITLLSGFINDHMLFLFPFIIIVFLIMYHLGSKLPKLRLFGLYLFIFSFFLTIMFVLLLHTPIESDFLTQYNAALALKNGTFNLEQSHYFQSWPYQLGLSLIEAGILKLFNHVMALKIFNALLIAATSFLVYDITKGISNEKTGYVAGVMYALFPTPLFFSTLLTNNIWGTFFSICALDLFFRSERTSSYKKHISLIVLVAIVLAVSNFARPDAILFLVPFIVYFLLKIVGQSKSYILSNSINIVTFILTFIIMSGLFSLGVKTAGISDMGLTNPDPGNRTAVGLYLKSNGRYSDDVTKKMDEYVNKSGLTRPEASKKITQENLHALKQASLRKIGSFVVSKQATYTFGSVDGLGFSIGYMNYPKLKKIFTKFNSLYILAVFTLAIYAAFYCVKSRRLELIVLPFIIFVGLCSNILNEVQYRYSYSIQPVMFIMAAIGLALIFNKKRERVTL